VAQPCRGETHLLNVNSNKMKKLLLLPVLFISFFFTGCFETTQELTIKTDGSGEISSNIDMSNAISMMAQMGMSEKEKLIYDTTVAFTSILDSVEGLTVDDKKALEKGLIMVNINTVESKLFITTKIPFRDVEDMLKLKSVLEKWSKAGGMSKVASKAFGETPGMDELGMDQKSGNSDPFSSLAENYFDVEYKKGKIKRSLIKDKYAKVHEDEALSKMKEMGEMGMPVKSNFVINLPVPAKNVSGKNVKLSDDKKKVTIENTLDELYDDPSKYEFTIEY